MRNAALAVICALLATASFADDQTLRGRARFTYYACVSPQEARCYAFTEDQEADCKACRQWEARLFDHDFSADLEAGRYLYKNGAARGNKVLADFEAAATGEPARKSPTFAQIYKSPERYGYVEIPREVGVQPGMAVVYPNFGGVIAAEAEAPSAARIVYSSKRSAGDLVVADLAMAAPDKPPKIVISQKLLELKDAAYWNVWMREQAGGALTTILRPGSSYDLKVDLAAFRYRGDSPAGEVSANAREEIDTWLARTADSIDLDLVLVTGDEFDDSYNRHQTLHIDLKKMRTWYSMADRPAPPTDALADIVAGSEPDYLFSSGGLFQLHTAKSARGMATVTVTMWNGIPIDEITFSICIASQEDEEKVCSGSSLLSRGFSAVPDDPTSPPPDVAVTLVAANPGSKVHGILRDNRSGADGKFVQWQLEETMAGLREFVAKTLEPALYTNNLLRTGYGFYQELFSTPEAREAFAQAIAAEMAQPLPDEPSTPPPPGAVKHPPRLLFRIVDENGLTTLPVSFLVWKRSADDYEPIGFHYLLDVPLGERIAPPSTGCISRWMLLYPPVPENQEEHDPVVLAALQAKSTLAQWSSVTQKPFAENDINSFGDWLSSGTETSGAAIVLLTHHASDRMWFEANQPITAALVGRSFASPTVAILDGCGTGGSAANKFAKRLSEKGIEAIVVTNTNVDADLAGDYLNTLAEELSADQSRDGFDLAYAHFHTLQRLRRKTDSRVNPTPYKARALTFMLVGNGALKLCGPQ